MVRPPPNCLAALCIAEEIEAAAAPCFAGGEECVTEIEEGGWPFGQQLSAGMRRNIGKTCRDIGPAGKNNRLDPGADRRHRCAGICTAIENCGERRVRNSLSRGMPHPAAPP